MPGQFPMSNWLTNKLNALHDDREPILSPGWRVEPEVTYNTEPYDLDLGWNIDLDSNLSSLPTAANASGGLPYLLPEEQNTQEIGEQPEKSSPERPVQPEFGCATCHLSFISQGKLNAHNRRHEKKHRCTLCDRRFSELRDLRRHNLSKHQQVWIHCPQCENWYKGREDNLRRHMTRYCKHRQHSLAT
ncbi:hypothetical protein F4804DRAFT_324658 [Jackrogersella minutella]|nr:hypothetical protein F4804DRAFT_324658 [Jackrogersella minutella]